jgi:hypothetical protein
MLRQGYMLEKGEKGKGRRAGFQTTEIAVCFSGGLFAITLTAVLCAIIIVQPCELTIVPLMSLIRCVYIEGHCIFVLKIFWCSPAPLRSGSNDRIRFFTYPLPPPLPLLTHAAPVCARLLQIYVQARRR